MNRTDSDAVFIHDAEHQIDYINANAFAFFAEIWEMEQENDQEIASPQALLELKAFALVQYYKNNVLDKIEACVYDIEFLCMKFGLRDVPRVRKYITESQYQEVLKIIRSVT